MGLKWWNVAVLAAVGTLWFAGVTQREKPVLPEAHAARVRTLEAAASARRDDPGSVRALAQAYLDARQPGMALNVVETAPAELRADPTVEHVYARALLEQGRSADALAAEKRVLELCASPERTCSSFLVASATRRADILHELVQLGVEDAAANPEQSRLAYQNATRHVTLVVR